MEVLSGPALLNAPVTAEKPRAPGESRDPRFTRKLEAVRRRGQVGSVYLEADRLVPPASPRAAKGHVTREERLAAMILMRPCLQARAAARVIESSPS